MEQSRTSDPVKESQSSMRSFFKPRTTSHTSGLVGTSASSPQNATRSINTTSINPPQTMSPRTSQPGPDVNANIVIHPQASISPIHEKHIQPLRRINALLLPINYPDSFYRNITDPTTTPNFSRIILWHDKPSTSVPNPEPKVVGGIVCRVEPSTEAHTASIYVQSLALLSPYRHYGLATAALEQIVACATRQLSNQYGITDLYAHVWTENKEAFEWYAARGFHRDGPILQNYYHRLRPGTAAVLRRWIKPSDHLRQIPEPVGTSQSSGPSAAGTQPPGTISKADGPPMLLRAASYQTNRPATEWNDLPSEILVPSRSTTPRDAGDGMLAAPTNGASGSRSSSHSREATKGGKKKRVYPTAAFSTN